MAVRGEARLYGRVVSYLGRYGRIVIAAILATVMFAVLDTFSMVMLIPFLNALFAGDDPAASSETEAAAAENGAGQAEGVIASDGSASPPLADDHGATGGIDWLLDQTLGRFVAPDTPADEQLTAIILFILAIFALKNFFDFLQTYLVVRLEQGVTRDLRNQVYSHLLDLDLRFFGRTRAGQVISRLTGDVDQLRSLITRNIAKAVTSTFMILASLAAMLLISARLTVIAVIVLPAMFGIWSRVLRRLRRGDRRVLNLIGEVSSHLQESVSGIRLVKAAGAENFERGRFRRLTEDFYRTYVKTETLRAVTGPLSEMLGAIGTVLLLWYGSQLVLVEGVVTPEAFIAFLAVSMKLYSPAKQLSKLPAVIQPGLAGAERVFEFLDAPIEIRDRKGAREFEGFGDAIRFENVYFEYEEDEPVLVDVNFTARAGEVIALVGPSGAGKTTLVDLVGRFYDPTGGRITIDGVDLREFSIDSLRAALGIVTQETVLFHDTVSANIAYGRPDAAPEAIERAARAANAHPFIVQLPEGYDTVLGERGTRLSGGQRQRIAIARAILRDPPILIFDEATSALDSESERLVQEAVEKLLAGRTVFVIAHRLSTIRHADQILVLRDGRIVETGRHDELLQKDGTYRQFYELQAAGV